VSAASASPLGLAVLGLGGMGEEHVRRLAGLGEFRVEGSFDIARARQERARELGLRPYPSLGRLLADPAVSVVLVATPNDAHKELSIAALRAGKHVICEKPVALSSAELEEILGEAKRAGRLFTVHQNRRWDEDYLTIKRILEEGSLGRLWHLETRVQGSRGIPGDWRKEARRGGGMLLDWGVHLLDRLVFLLPGPIETVYCRFHYPTGQEVDEGFHLLLSFASGQAALVEVSTCHYQSLPLWLAVGTRGTAVIQDWELHGGIVALPGRDGALGDAGREGDAVPIAAGAGLTKTMAPRAAEAEVRLPLPVVRADQRDFYRNFAQAIRGEAAQAIKNEEVTRIMRLIEASFESARRGEAVRFEG
jgi:scyllo-inositol 2-dehydrogenase (NADP+)